MCFVFKSYEGIRTVDLQKYIIDRLPNNNDKAAKERYIAKIKERINELGNDESMIDQNKFCELMKSFNLTQEEIDKGCWSDERLFNHFMTIHFKYQSGLDQGENGEVTEEIFTKYVEKFCSLNNRKPEAIETMYNKYFGDQKSLDFPRFMKMIFGDAYEVYVHPQTEENNKS